MKSPICLPLQEDKLIYNDNSAYIKMYLIDGPVQPRKISELIEKCGKNTETGAHSFFLGVVRSDRINGKSVKAIEYSAFDEMVKVEAEKIKTTIFSEFSDVRSIVILHSKGEVKAGEISLLVLISAGHRHHAIQACSKTVEMIKENLPVWKREIFEDNTYYWKQNE